MTSHVDVAQTGLFATEDLVPPLVLRWRVKVEGSSSVLAADGRVYVVGQRLTALDQRDGHQLWSVDQARFATATYDAGRVFLADDVLRAFAADSGAQLWSQKLTTGALPSEPLASGGAVYVTFGGTTSAYRAADGTPLWAKSSPGGAKTMALDGSRIYVAGGCARTMAFDRATGNTVWDHKTGCTGGGLVEPSLLSGRLWVPADEGTNGSPSPPPILDAATGEVTGRFAGRRVVFVDGRAVVSDTEGSRLKAYDLGSGGVVWEKPDLELDAAIAIGHDVYGLRPGREPLSVDFVALDPETGKEIWSTPAPATDPSLHQAPSAIAAVPGLVIVGHGNYVSAYASALRPPPDGIALGSGARELYAGQTASLVGVLGANVRAARPQVAVERAGWRHGGFRTMLSLRPDRDGGFAAVTTITRNTRYRVTAAGVSSNAVTVYANPRVKFGSWTGSRRRAVVPVRVSAKGSRLGRHRFVLYFRKTPRGRLRRIGSARLSGRSRAHGRVVVHGFPHQTRRSTFWFCIKGELRMGLGRPSPITRRCGARSLRRP